MAARSRRVLALVWSMVPVAAMAATFVIEGCKRWST
jgi:hypothetical protein